MRCIRLVQPKEIRKLKIEGDFITEGAEANK